MHLHRSTIYVLYPNIAPPTRRTTTTHHPPIHPRPIQSNPQEGFHDLRRATEQRYLQYRRDHFAQEAAAQCAAVAVRRAQRTRWYVKKKKEG